MDFAKKLIQHENVVTKSGIKLLKLPPPDNSENIDDESRKKHHVQKLLIESANKAATHLFLSSGTNIYSTLNKNKERGKGKEQDKDDINGEGSSSSPVVRTVKEEKSQSLVNCELYPTQLLPPSSKILPSSLVVIFESFDSLNFVYAKPGEVFHNRNGHFHHDDFINKPYGCKIRSRNNQGVGFVYLLKPTPELWQRSLNHRTQIVHELDASLITFELNLRPNMVVCESGTGSGALSHCIMRTIAPYGKLHTFEFNHARVIAAREEFKKNGVDHLVDVHWRDVCGKPKSCKEGKSGTLSNNNHVDDGDSEETIGVGGFDIGGAKADAIFLDLPKPWLAIPHAAYTIKPYGNLCSYSPCIEQSQQTIQEMKKYGFHSIKTIEVRLREHYVDEVTMDRAPTMKLPREPVIPYIPGTQTPAPAPAPSEPQTAAVSDKNAKSSNGHDEKGESEEENKDETIQSTESELKKVSEGESNDAKPKNGNKRKSPPLESSSERETLLKKTKLNCARPFATIKGHTAFLTFAHAGNKLHQNPLANISEEIAK